MSRPLRMARDSSSPEKHLRQSQRIASRRKIRSRWRHSPAILPMSAHLPETVLLILQRTIDQAGAIWEYGVELRFYQCMTAVIVFLQIPPIFNPYIQIIALPFS